MKQKLYSLLLTALLGMTGMNAWAQATYEITCAEDLVDFANAVNDGETDANAVLTTDIDLEGVDWTPIGNSDSKKYTGTFDGQGHAITGFEYTATAKYNGLFGYINNATVKNFSISGTLTADGFAQNGVIGQADGTSVVSGIHSSLTINVANCSSHSGGIVGGTGGNTGHTVLIEKCEYSGTMTHSGTGDCQAGIVGYTYYGTIKNCIFSGTITGEGSKYGGILAYCKVPGFGGVQNCLCIGKIVANSGNSTAAAIIANWNGGATANVKNNYYCLQEGSTTTIAIGNKASSCEAPNPLTDEQIASGEACYLLNGDQSTIAFYQTIPDDQRPTFDATHGQVYVNGRQHCNGDAYEGTFYSNENVGIVTDDHDYSNGFCTYCDKLDDSFDADYLIKNATQLKNLATFVNAGNFTVNAKLTDDIDMSSLSSWIAIGNWGSTSNGSACFQGHFDGQGHTIKNFNFTATHNYYGLFGVISTGALIENFCINGTINSSYQYAGGVAAYSRDNTPTIRNIHSFVNINNTYSGGRPGGILGGAPAANSKTIIENCAYSGTLNAGELGGNYGGIVGYVNNNSTTVIEITNCLFNGVIQNGTANGACGGIVGYNNGGTATIKNCLSVGSITSGAAGQLFGTLNGNNSTYDNCYYKGTAAQIGSGTPKGTTPVKVTDEQLASGEICYALNGDQSNIAFYQNIDEGDADAVPVLDATHGQVYLNGHQHCDGTAYEGASSYSNANLGMVQDDHDFVDGFCSNCNSLDETFLTANEGVFEIGTPAQLKWFAAYVNQVDAAANAILTDNIDMEGVAWNPIGKTVYYTGTFNGQGFTISNLTYAGVGDYNGMFGKVKDATIGNFSINGTLDCAGNCTGLIGWSEGSIISDIQSALIINAADGTLHHAGGIVGSARQNGTVGTKVERCSYSGTMTVNEDSHDCFGGIVGYTTDYCTVANCVNYGSISFKKATGYVGGIIGYINSTGCYGAHNCLNVGAIIYDGEGDPTYGGAIVGRLRGNDPNKWGYNYWLEGSAANANGENQIPTNYMITAEQLQNGYAAAKLAPAFRQNIGSDEAPLLDATHNVVAEITDAGYATLYVADTDLTVPAGVEAFTSVILNEGWLHLNAITSGAIAADEAVVLAGEAGIYSFVPTTGATKAAENVLKGATEDVAANGKYVLAKPADNPAGFYKATSGTIKAGRAYLELPEESDVKAFYFAGDDATGIEGLNTLNTQNTPIYNLAGQRVSKTQKGINIVGGKKVLK